jgi:hypothetical protein
MNFVFNNYEPALAASKWLQDRLIQKKTVCVADFCDYAGFTRAIEDKFRVWSAPIIVRIHRYRKDEWIVELPDPEHIGNSNRSKATPDIVSHSPHYQAKNGMEAIDVIEAFTTGLEGIEATDTGNILKYMCRWKSKNGLQDLEKAQWYLTHLINHVKENTK